MGRKRMVKVPEPEARLRYCINGHELSGVKYNGVWSFVCVAWPDLAAKHEEATSAEEIIAEFTGRALAGAVTIKRLYAEATAQE